MPFVNGIEAARQIRASVPGTGVLVFTMHEDETVVDQVMRAGAHGCVFKSEAQAELPRAVESVARGKTFFGRVDPLTDKRNVKRTTLTNQQRRIVQLVAKDYTNKQIASALGVSQKTVETHRHAIRTKLNLTTTAGLVRYAFRNGIASLDD
jgi:DNA-binding NarL/FixJ family response regulator